VYKRQPYKVRFIEYIKILKNQTLSEVRNQILLRKAKK